MQAGLEGCHPSPKHMPVAGVPTTGETVSIRMGHMTMGFLCSPETPVMPAQ